MFFFSKNKSLFHFTFRELVIIKEWIMHDFFFLIIIKGARIFMIKFFKHLYFVIHLKKKKKKNLFSSSFRHYYISLILHLYLFFFF